MAISANNPAPLFGEGASGTLRLVIYLVAAIALMTADRRGDWLEHLRAGAGIVVEPLYRLAAAPSGIARAMRVEFADRRALTEQNAELSRQLLLAQTQLRRAAAVQEQNLRLQELLSVQKNLGLSVQLAHVIDVDFGPYKRQTLMLDLGSENDVAVGQPVIDARGLLGQIVEVGPRSCTVLLITDASHALPVRVERTGLRTIARGTGAIDALELPNIPTSADVKEGDKLVTSGLGGRFPADFPVGTIRSIGAGKTGMFVSALATPAAALDRTGEVLVLHEVVNPFGPPKSPDAYGPPASLAMPANAAPAPPSAPVAAPQGTPPPVATPAETY